MNLESFCIYFIARSVVLKYFVMLFFGVLITLYNQVSINKNKIGIKSNVLEKLWSLMAGSSKSELAKISELRKK